MRALLGAGLKFDEDRAICFSSEKADQATLKENGIENASTFVDRPVPEVYSADLSEFVFAAGVKLLKNWAPDVMYLSTTDYIQHKFAPDEMEAKDFYAMFDRYLTELDALGAAIVVTADHGMKPKHKIDGTPAVIYSGFARQMARRKSRPGNFTHHRPIRRTSWRFRLFCNSLFTPEL